MPRPHGRRGFHHGPGRFRSRHHFYGYGRGYYPTYIPVVDRQVHGPPMLTILLIVLVVIALVLAMRRK